MSAVVRKGVLLRFDPELLVRVDAVKAGLKRTEFLMDLIERGVSALEAPRPVPVTHPAAGAMTPRGRIPVIGEDGESMGLYAERRADGALEISAAEDAASEYSNANDANGDSGLDGSEPFGDDPALDAPEGSDSGVSDFEGEL